MIRLIYSAGIGLAIVLSGTQSIFARPQITLDGQWAFRFASDEAGEGEGWFKTGVAFDRQLEVPGCWDAQGVGQETDKMRHQAIGVGWYRRTFELPADWAGKRVWLFVGGAHRSAKIWVNEQLVGEHWGYPVAFRFDVSKFIKADGPQLLVMAVDSRRHPQRDPLTGTFDIIDYMDIDWGGIYEHVRLECTNDVWIEDAWVKPDPAKGVADVEVSLGDVSDRQPGGISVAYSVHSWSRRGVLSSSFDSGRCDVGEGVANFRLDLTNAPSWTPAEPNLLFLRLRLVRGGAVIDEHEVRFGQRLLEIRGPDFYLNGERFFLRGYGDDFNFPRELVPPADVDYWRDYLQLRKNYGFNGVRHHSMMPVESYFQAADEVGMLIQPELPIAYWRFWEAANEQGRDLYRYVWPAYIHQMRNHPSVFAWCMGNELWEGFKLGPELYEKAKRLDPTRPVIEGDGQLRRTPRPTLDYMTIQFGERSIPWGKDRRKYAFKSPASVPVIVHEMSNLVALPDPADIPLFTGVIKPFWLEEMGDKVKALKLERYLPAMIEASERLQGSLLKLNIESARLSPDVDGHHQWLFRDYWTQSSGFVNYFDRPRKISQSDALKFNAEAVLLWDRNRVSFYSGEQIDLKMFLSDFRPASARAIDKVRVQLNAETFELNAPKELGTRGLVGPWTGTLPAPQVSKPRKYVLTVQAGCIRNEWPIWVFPSPVSKDQEEVNDALLTRRLTEEVLKKLIEGGRVWVMDDRHVFPCMVAQFKTAWWKGKETKNHTYGNMLLPHPSLVDFPHDGYGDLQMYNMMDDRPVVLMDQFPTAIEPIVWCLDLPWRMWRKAYLFEARVGQGRLLFSTLNFSKHVRQDDPAARWLFQELLAYVSSDEFQPDFELSADWLRQRVQE